MDFGGRKMWALRSRLLTGLSIWAPGDIFDLRLCPAARAVRHWSTHRTGYTFRELSLAVSMIIIGFCGLRLQHVFGTLNRGQRRLSEEVQLGADIQCWSR